MLMYNTSPKVRACLLLGNVDNLLAKAIAGTVAGVREIRASAAAGFAEASAGEAGLRVQALGDLAINGQITSEHIGAPLDTIPAEWQNDDQN